MWLEERAEREELDTQIIDHLFGRVLLQKGAGKLGNNLWVKWINISFSFFKLGKIMAGLCAVWKVSIELEKLMRVEFLKSP